MKSLEQSKNINKTQLRKLLSMHGSISKTASNLGWSRKRLTNLMKLYDMKTNAFFTNNSKINQLKDTSLTFKEASIKLGVDVTTVKYYRQTQDLRHYNKQQICDKFTEYRYDFNRKSRGLSEQIKLDDPCLYEAIMRETENHTLTTNKFSERIYRLVNSYNDNQHDACTHCQKPLKFYTFGFGYGNSDLKICQSCFPKYSSFGVSKASQLLFWQIYDKLISADKCHFHELNEEMSINIDKTQSKKPHSNKHKYKIDFVLSNKIIEFDGDYWHKKTKHKDAIKDEYLKSLGYEVLRVKEQEYKKDKESIISKCLNFLNQ